MNGIFSVILAAIIPNFQPAASIHSVNWYGLEKEIATIRYAAELNGCTRPQNFSILLAIRKSENGGRGREFGIIHPLCDEIMERFPERTLGIQARWSAATIMKNRDRWLDQDNVECFIDFLADAYCPPSDDPKGNKNWKKNVKHWQLKYWKQL